MRIRQDDTVQVISGNEKGKQGTVLKVFPARSRAIVEGINFIKRHTKPSQINPQGGIVEKEASIHLSNLMLICPKCDRRTRAKIGTFGDGRTRICRRCGEMIGEM